MREYSKVVTEGVSSGREKCANFQLGNRIKGALGVMARQRGTPINANAAGGMGLPGDASGMQSFLNQMAMERGNHRWAQLGEAATARAGLGMAGRVEPAHALAQQTVLRPANTLIGSSLTSWAPDAAATRPDVSAAFRRNPDLIRRVR